MRKLSDARDIDAKNFYRLVLIVRSISVSRPQNLTKFTEQYTNKPIDETDGKIRNRISRVDARVTLYSC